MQKKFETFREISDYAIRLMIDEAPSCLNGKVNVKKYKVTIEEIEEPKEVIAERLQKLWDQCTNWHHRQPLRDEAAKIGYTLKF